MYPSKICFFSLDEIHDYYLQVWEYLSKTSKFNLAEPDLVRIRYKNMRIFFGNFIHGEGFRNEISPGNSFIQLIIMDRNIRFSKCKIFYNDKFEYGQVTEKDMKDYRFQIEISSSCHASGDFRKVSDCSSRSQTLEGLMIVPSFSS